jgi:sulfur carrier protein ThiS
LNNKSIKPFKIKRNIKVKLWARLTQENVNTLSISCIHASVLQSVHTTSNETSVELNEEYQVENILEKRWLVEKPTILSNEKNTIPQKTHENSKRTYSTVQEHYNSLREGSGQ